ncbi:MAG: hypothetical protein GX444_18020 [Myxococcales bacterium]|nr:hypothetical protein [Myxococcales bacterium]
MNRRGVRLLLLCLVFTAAGLSCGDDGEPDNNENDGDNHWLVAGFRASRYGIEPFPNPVYWGEVSREMAGRFAGAEPGGVWIVGVFLDDGSCELNFPSPGGEYAKIAFGATDQNEAYLNWFDKNDVRVWLQVEPGAAEVATLIDLVLRRYGHHGSVAGIGIDVEWYRADTVADGQAVTDGEAAAWSELVRGYDPSYTLFFKHWLPEKMPPQYRTGLFFIDDSMALGSLAALVEEFGTWSEALAPAPVGFQFGYDEDRAWWGQLADPPGDIGRALRAAIDRTAGLFWVDFTIDELFPSAD